MQMKTMLEEVDVRLAESRRETHEFQRAVIVGAEHPRTGCTMADKFVKCAPLAGGCSGLLLAPLAAPCSAA